MHSNLEFFENLGFEEVAQRTGPALAAIVLLSIPLLFFYIGGWSFLDPDEGRYGHIPQQMLVRSDFVTPTQNEVKFFDKPPLLYWIIAASYAVFGFHEWSARLVPATAALVGLLTAYGLGRRVFGARAGLVGAVILATSCMWPTMAHIVLTDMLVSLFILIALAFWWFGHSEPVDADVRRQTGYFVGFWATLALAVLAKGPVTVVLVGAAISIYMLVCRQWSAVSTMRWGLGIPLFLLISAPWYILVAQRNPEFNHYFWYDQHIARFLGRTTGNDHVQDASYYFKFLPLIFFPWSLFVPAAVVAGWGNPRFFTARKRGAELSFQGRSKQQAAIYLLSGVAFTLLFFSTSSGKLLTYILPIVPLLALLLGAYFDYLLSRNGAMNRILSVGVAVLSLLLITGGLAVAMVAPSKLRSLDVNEWAALGLGLVLVVWAITLIVCSWRFQLRGLIAATAGGFTVAFVTVMALVADVTPHFTTAPLVDYIRPGLTPQAEVLTMSYIRSIPFYVQRRVEILGTPDELKFGVEQMKSEERQQWFFDGPAQMRNLREEMTDPHPVYCFVRIRKQEQGKVKALIRQIGNGAAPIIANERFLVFGNRAVLTMTPPQPAGLSEYYNS